MPCFSKIINTKMSYVDNILKAAGELGWLAEVKNDKNYIGIRADDVKIDLIRNHNSENFSTNTNYNKHLTALQKQYNVVQLKNWADKLGYEVKEVKREITI